MSRFNFFYGPRGWDAFWREFDSIFDHADQMLEFPKTSRLDMANAITMRQDGNDYHIRYAVPGVDPDDIRVTCDEQTLTIRAQRTDDKRDFSQTIQVPADFALDRAEASYKHGLLTIRVPRCKKPAEEQHEIPIKK